MIATAAYARPAPGPALLDRMVNGPDIIGLVSWGLNTYTDKEWGATGSGLAETTWNRTGSGAETFAFAAQGLWTVTLEFEDGTVRTAQIDIVTDGLVIFIM